MVAASSAAPVDLGKVIEARRRCPSLLSRFRRARPEAFCCARCSPSILKKRAGLHMTGSVVIDAVVNVEGQVDDLKLVSGDPLLSAAAMDAVRKWRYSPYLLNGKPIPQETRITISFIAP